MPTKLQFYSYLAERTAEQLTDRVENWTSFLTTSARLYKYPYHEQLMIYAQQLLFQSLLFLIIIRE